MNKNYYFDTPKNKKAPNTNLKQNTSTKNFELDTDCMENELYSEIIKNTEKN